MTVLGLRCSARALSSCGERVLLFVVVRRLLIVVASLVAEHGLYGAWASLAVAHGLQQLWLTGLVAPWHVGSSRTRARTPVSCTGRQILKHCATREAHILSILNSG